MFFTTPSTKEHTMKRTIITVVAAVLAALALSAVASAKPAPALVHGGKASPAHRSVRLHTAHLGHHHVAV